MFLAGIRRSLKTLKEKSLYVPFKPYASILKRMFL